MLSSLHLIQLGVLAFALFAASRVYLRFKEGTVSPFSFLFWMVLWLGTVVLTFFPTLSNPLAKLLGIGRGVDAFFFLAILLLFYLIYRIYVKLEKIEREITQIISKEGLENTSRTPGDTLVNQS